MAKGRPSVGGHSGVTTVRTRAGTMSALALVGVAAMVSNAAAYLLSMGAARMLSVPGYGALGSLLALSLIGSTASVAVQSVAARQFAAHGSTTQRRRLLAAHTARLAGWIAVAGLGAAWPLSTALGISWLEAFLTVAAIAAAVPGFSALGFLQGDERFTRFSLAYVALASLRAGGGLAALAIHPSVLSACLGLLAGTALGSALAMVLARHPLAIGPRSTLVNHEIRLMTMAILGLYVLSNTDVLLARTFLDPEASGLYAVGALVAKVAFFLPSFVLSVFFPRIASGTARASTTALVTTATIGLLFAGATAVLSDLVVLVLGGEKYTSVAPAVPLFALLGGAFAVAQVVLYTGFSRLSSVESRMVWVALGVQVGVVGLALHDTLVEIAATTTVVSLVLAAVTIWYQHARQGMTRREPAALRPPLEENQ